MTQPSSAAVAVKEVHCHAGNPHSARGGGVSPRFPGQRETRPRQACGLGVRQLAIIDHKRRAFFPQLLEILGDLSSLSTRARRWPRSHHQHPRHPRAPLLRPGGRGVQGEAQRRGGLSPRAWGKLAARVP